MLYFRVLGLFFLAAVMQISAGLASDAEFPAVVIHVADGDTVIVLDNYKSQIVIRLAEIDAPEDGQPWGARSRQYLRELALNKAVTVSPVSKDRYDRTVASLKLGNENVSAKIVASGNAWVFRHYLIHPELLNLEAQARAAKRGLWSMPEGQIVPPWTWRKNRRNFAPIADPSCGTKRYCREMDTCNEAKFYFQSCGAGWLDGDGDGVPCEKVCRNN